MTYFSNEVRISGVSRQQRVHVCSHIAASAVRRSTAEHCFILIRCTLLHYVKYCRLLSREDCFITGTRRHGLASVIVDSHLFENT